METLFIHCMGEDMVLIKFCKEMLLSGSKWKGDCRSHLAS